MTLNEKFHELLKKANELKMVEFLFEHEGQYYVCIWEGVAWSDPMKITKL